MEDLVKIRSPKDLEKGYSRRVQNFKERGVDCITIDYEEYKRLNKYAELGRAISKLSQDEKQYLTIDELLEELKNI